MYDYSFSFFHTGTHSQSFVCAKRMKYYCINKHLNCLQCIFWAYNSIILFSKILLIWPPFCSLKQHNGELKGGAKASQAGRPWICACLIRGFESKSEGKLLIYYDLLLYYAFGPFVFLSIFNRSLLHHFFTISFSLSIGYYHWNNILITPLIIVVFWIFIVSWSWLTDLSY